MTYAEPHWVLYVLFVALFIAILGTLIGTCVYSHERNRKEQSAGWWAGVVLVLPVLADSSSDFQSVLDMPGNPVFSLVSQTIDVRWAGLIISAILAAVALKIAEVVEMPNKIMALLMLVCTFFSLYFLFALFLIRTHNALIFSSYVGFLFGLFAYRAFLREQPAK